MAFAPWQSYSLDEVKDLSILDVCDQLGVFVERRGKNYWCKLRDENVPSTILHPENNTFYDFGTQQHGSNIDLACTVTGMSFHDAVRHLGEAFSLQPESQAERRLRFRTMSKADYTRIGLHWDLATKNFTFPTDRCDTGKLIDIELRYQMPMNALRKKHPKTYERIIREKAIPFVEKLRNLYYLEIWNHYSLLQSTGRTVFFYDSDRTRARFADLTHQLEQAERSLYKAGQGTGLVIPAPAQYDPMRVMGRFLTDRLSISIGTCTPEELMALSKDDLSMLQLSEDVYYDARLEDIPHAAVLTKDNITLSCRRQDLPLVKRRIYLHSAPTRSPDIDHTIHSAATRKKDTLREPDQKEQVFTR